MIIAPVGAYFGRVKKGLEWALGFTYIYSNTEVKITLVVAASWMTEPEYAAKVDELASNFLQKELMEQFRKLTVSTEAVDLEDETSCAAWLLTTLSAFLTSAPDNVAYVDMTSAPMEWILACQYVAEFFDRDRICFYYVKSRQVRGPQEFLRDLARVEDSGVIPEKVILSGPDPILKEWMTEGTENWKLFRTIYDMIADAAKQAGKSMLITSVPLRALVDRAIEWMERGSARRKVQDSESRARKSVSKRLTSIRKFGLFIEELGTIRLTHRGYALALSLFHVPESTRETKSQRALS